MSKTSYVSPWDLAILYVGLGDKERAWEQLNKAYEDRAAGLLISRSSQYSIRCDLIRALPNW